MITIDDGYLDNLTLAAPLLERYDFCATIAVIGCSVGKDTYKDTGEPIIPHFSLEQAAEYQERGILDFQTHSYDMHQVARLDGDNCRSGVLQLDGESEADYVSALTEDFLRSKEQLESQLDVSCRIYTYPGGLYTCLLYTSGCIPWSPGRKASASFNRCARSIRRPLSTPSERSSWLAASTRSRRSNTVP